MGLIKEFRCLRRFAKDFTDLQAHSLTQQVTRDFPSTPQNMGTYQQKLCRRLFLPQPERCRAACFYKSGDKFLAFQQTNWKLTGATETLSPLQCRWQDKQPRNMFAREIIMLSEGIRRVWATSEPSMQDSTCTQSHRLSWCTHSLKDTFQTELLAEYILVLLTSLPLELGAYKTRCGL